MEVGEEGGNSVANEPRGGVVCAKSEGMCNGFMHTVGVDAGEGSSGMSEGLRTYKRRRQGNSSSDGKSKCAERMAGEDDKNLASKTEREICERVVDSNSSKKVHTDMMDSHNVAGCSYSPKEARNLILERICRSLNKDEGGLGRCIQDSLELTAADFVNESGNVQNGRDKCTEGAKRKLNRDAAGRHAKANGSNHQLNHHSVTEKCLLAFANIIASGKFMLLCNLLSKNFQETTVEGLLDFNMINSRLKGGAYESSPMLFTSDLQQVWGRLEGIGSGLVSVAKSLSDMSWSTYRELVGEPAQMTPEGGVQKACGRVRCNTKVEQPETCGASEICTCRNCGEKADGRDCLICDSCEEMYHVSCIKPAVKDIPPRSWYCASCMASGMGSSHENCAVCERLIASRNSLNLDGGIMHTNDEMLGGLQGSFYHNMNDGPKLSKAVSSCKICGNMVGDDENFRICDHAFCPHSYYHVRCLTAKQLKSHGPRWYCPSCLCRSCLADRDDDKIVLCDGCDHAYHIYCMKPPRTSVPKGKWFCGKCEAGLEAIRKAKRACKSAEVKLGKKVAEGDQTYPNAKKQAENGDEELDKGGGAMDMLLTAAKTLNSE